ncbi:MAG: hypothetical protein KF894_29455 [Labilithrix sp.]|nr:hypothetical protein [Labilithrix sp.]
MTGPRVAHAPPAGWSATAELPKPKIADSAGASLVAWSAHRSADGDAALVSGCVATPIPGWVEDMRPAVEGRTVALAGASAAAITGAPVDARPGADGIFELRAVSELAGPPIGHARTFVGFDDARVLTCFATCVGTRATPSPRACDASVVAARLEGSSPPPAAGLALRGATWAVHHPRPTALGAGALAATLAVVALVTRRRPRSRIA